jgi:hypothetical protein
MDPMISPMESKSHRFTALGVPKATEISQGVFMIFPYSMANLPWIHGCQIVHEWLTTKCLNYKEYVWFKHHINGLSDHYILYGLIHLHYNTRKKICPILLLHINPIIVPSTPGWLMWDPLPPSPWELLMAALLTLRFWMTRNWGKYLQ